MDGSFMAFCNAACNGKTDSKAAGLVISGLIRPVETVKQMPERILVKILTDVGGF